MKRAILAALILAALTCQTHTQQARAAGTMSYKVTAIKRVDDTLFTAVTYNINGTIVEVSIPHFRPASKAEVLEGIKNRGLSEKAKLQAAATLDAFMSTITLNEETQVP